MLREKTEDQSCKNRQNKIDFQIPETAHHHRESVCVGILMQIPVTQILPLRYIRNIHRNIFTAEGRVEILQPGQAEEMQANYFKNVISEK